MRLPAISGQQVLMWVWVWVARCGHTWRSPPFHLVGICWPLNWPLLGNCTMSPRLARVLTGWQCLGGGPLGFETADRIGDCQVQRAGCLIPAVLFAEKGHHAVNSGVSRELGTSGPHAPRHAVPHRIDYLPALGRHSMCRRLPRSGPYCTYSTVHKLLH